MGHESFRTTRAKALDARRIHVGETEGFVDRQISLHNEHGCARCLGLLKYVSSSSVQHSVDSSYSILWTLNFHKINGLHHSWRGSHHGGVEDSPGSRNDLSTTSMDGVGV